MMNWKFPIESLGRIFIFFLESIGWLFRKPSRWKIILEEMEFVGNQSLVIVGITGAFTGAVLAYQLWMALEIVGTDALVLAMTALSLVRQLGPILTGIVVAGRAGAAMAAQIGLMRVTDQIDALEVMAVSPKQYLIGPKILASILATPILMAVFSMVGTLTGYFIVVFVCHIDPGVSVSQFSKYMAPWDFLHGFIKSFVYGAVLSTIGCYKGFRANHGASGVGRATNEAVVYSIVTVIVLDFFLSTIVPNGNRVEF